MSGNFWIYTGLLLGIIVICWPVEPTDYSPPNMTGY